MFFQKHHKLLKLKSFPSQKYVFLPMLFFFSNLVVVLKVAIIHKNVLAKFGQFIQNKKVKKILRHPSMLQASCDKI
jgi:hypothetical protein